MLTDSRSMFQTLLPPENARYHLLSKEYKLPYPYTLTILRKSHVQLYEMKKDDFEALVQKYTMVFEDQQDNKFQLIEEREQNYKDEGYESDEFQYFDEAAYFKDVRGEKMQWKYFPKEIFTIFWLLDLQDIHHPEDVYDDIFKMKDQQITKMKNYGSDNRKNRDEISWITKIKHNLTIEKESGKKKHHEIMKYLKAHIPVYFG